MRVISTCLLLLAASFTWAQTTETELITVDATGYGRTSKEAEVDALRAVVQKAVGVFVSAETLVKNEDLISDKILTFSNGFVKEYKTLAPKKNTQLGLYEVSINAKVFRQKLLSKLDENKIAYSIAVSGQNLFAQALTVQNREEDANKLFDATLQDLFVKNVDKLYRVRLIDPNGRTGDKFLPNVTSLGNNKAKLVFFVEVSYDLDYWNNTVVPRWTTVLDQISAVKDEEQSVSFNLEEAGSASFPIDLTGQPGVTGKWTPEGEFRFFGGAPFRNGFRSPERLKNDESFFWLMKSDDQSGEFYKIQGYTVRKIRNGGWPYIGFYSNDILNVFVDLVTDKGQVILSQNTSNFYRFVQRVKDRGVSGEVTFLKDEDGNYQFDKLTDRIGYFVPLFENEYSRGHWSQYYVKRISIEMSLADIKKVSKFIIRKVKA